MFRVKERGSMWSRSLNVLAHTLSPRGMPWVKVVGSKVVGTSPGRWAQRVISEPVVDQMEETLSCYPTPLPPDRHWTEGHTHPIQNFHPVGETTGTGCGPQGRMRFRSERSLPESPVSPWSVTRVKNPVQVTVHHLPSTDNSDIYLKTSRCSHVVRVTPIILG